MKKNKILSKNKILAVLIVLLGIASSIFTISAITTDNSDTETVVVNDEMELKEKDELAEKELGEKDENDLLAITLMRKYKRTELTELPNNKVTDCELMRSMCTIINEGILSDSEEYVLKSYLSRRIGWLNVPNDTDKFEDEDKLQYDIETILGLEHEED